MDSLEGDVSENYSAYGAEIANEIQDTAIYHQFRIMYAINDRVITKLVHMIVLRVSVFSPPVY